MISCDIYASLHQKCSRIHWVLKEIGSSPACKDARWRKKSEIGTLQQFTSQTTFYILPWWVGVREPPKGPRPNKPTQRSRATAVRVRQCTTATRRPRQRSLRPGSDWANSGWSLMRQSPGWGWPDCEPSICGRPSTIADFDRETFQEKSAGCWPGFPRSELLYVFGGMFWQWETSPETSWRANELDSQLYLISSYISRGDLSYKVQWVQNSPCTIWTLHVEPLIFFSISCISYWLLIQNCCAHFSQGRLKRSGAKKKRTQTAHQSRPKLDMCWKCPARTWWASRTLTTFGTSEDHCVYSPSTDQPKPKWPSRTTSYRSRTSKGWLLVPTDPLYSLIYVNWDHHPGYNGNWTQTEASTLMAKSLRAWLPSSSIEAKTWGLALGPSLKIPQKKWTLTSGCPDRNHR